MEQKNKCVYDEYNRLKGLLGSVDETKAGLVEEIIKKASFLKVELTRLETVIIKNGTIEYSNRGNQRISLAYKTYLQSLGVYQSLIRTLNTIIGKSVIDEDDDFDDFLSSLETR